MKIEKLLTLSQFVELVQSKVMSYEIESNMFGLTCKYKDFLKQPLTKEMFVNPLGEWNMSKNGLKDSDEYRAWQEAEKKVIFNFLISDNSTNNNSIEYVATYLQFVIWIYSDDQFAMYVDHDEEVSLLTLGDLAEATNGELTLKNVTI